MTEQAKPRRRTAEEKVADAMRVRDAAIAIVKEKGQWTSLKAAGRDIPIMSAEHGALSILYTTPFAKLPQQPTIPAHLSEADRHAAAVMIQQKFVPMPYGIDVWASNKKVFNVEWNDDGAFLIVAFKRGEWEGQLTP